MCQNKVYLSKGQIGHERLNEQCMGYVYEVFKLCHTEKITYDRDPLLVYCQDHLFIFVCMNACKIVSAALYKYLLQNTSTNSSSRYFIIFIHLTEEEQFVSSDVTIIISYLTFDTYHEWKYYSRQKFYITKCHVFIDLFALIYKNKRHELAILCRYLTSRL